MTSYWLSTPRFTVAIDVEDGIIAKQRNGPPIVRRWVERPLDDLLAHLTRQGGGYTLQEISEESPHAAR